MNKYKDNKSKKFLKLYLTIFISTITLLGCNSKSMLENEGEFLDYVNIDRAKTHVEYLSNDIGVRAINSNEENKAAQYIENQFKSMGYKVNLQKFNNFSGKSINIEAIKTPSGKDSNDTDEIVYVTAHYDSIADSPGANDNSSGIACMLEIANIVKDLDIDREIRFVAFSAEELALIGSERYVNKLKEDDIPKSIACFNLDMVATSYDGFDEIRAYTVDGNENIVTTALSKARKEFESNLYLSERKLYNDISNGKINILANSDHYNFHQIGIPSALFINVNPLTEEFSEPYMHTQDDNLDNINLQRLERSINLIGKAIYSTININD